MNTLVHSSSAADLSDAWLAANDGGFADAVMGRVVQLRRLNTATTPKRGWPMTIHSGSSLIASTSARLSQGKQSTEAMDETSIESGENVHS